MIPPKQKTPCQTQLYLTKRSYFYLNLSRTFQKFHQHASSDSDNQKHRLDLLQTSNP